MPDIKRVFSYHGAEHKTIFCYEAKQPLTVENVKKFKRFHPRCGTSFLVLMLLISILVSMVVLNLFPVLKIHAFWWTGVKILLVPVICGIGYEILKLCGRHDNWLTRIVSAPGVWVQRLTTKEPDDKMIEVAIASLQAVLPEGDEVAAHSTKIAVTDSGKGDLPLAEPVVPLESSSAIDGGAS